MGITIFMISTLQGFDFQEAQEKLLELDRQSNKLDAFIEKSKNATIEESEVMSEENKSLTQASVPG